MLAKTYSAVRLKQDAFEFYWQGGQISLNNKLKISCTHTVNFGSEMVQAKHVSGKNIFCSMNKEKIRKERIFEIIHCPFEGQAKLHQLCKPNGPVGQGQLGGNSKGQCTISKIIFPLLLYTFTEQNIFFPETCFAYPISEQKFTV